MSTKATQQALKIGGLELLPPELLVRTGPVDHAAWNYAGVLGAIQRTRFRLIARLIGDSRFDALLEAGYGSGVFAPELSRHCTRYCGVDTHPHAAEVNASLASIGIVSDLRQGSVTEIPFGDKSFECVVGISVFEFVDDHDAAFREIHRVLKDDGLLLLVTPGHSPLLDLGLKILTGESAKRDFQGRRERVIPAATKQFEIAKVRDYPAVNAFGLYMYRALTLRKLRPTFRW